jgi:hypothetical protein
MKLSHVILKVICIIIWSFNLHASSKFYSNNHKKNIEHPQKIIHKKNKSSREEKNVIRGSDDRDEDCFVKSSENPLNEDAFEFDLNNNQQKKL